MAITKENYNVFKRKIEQKWTSKEIDFSGRYEFFKHDRDNYDIVYTIRFSGENISIHYRQSGENKFSASYDFNVHSKAVKCTYFCSFSSIESKKIIKEFISYPSEVMFNAMEFYIVSEAAKRFGIKTPSFFEAQEQCSKGLDNVLIMLEEELKGTPITMYDLGFTNY